MLQTLRILYRLVESYFEGVSIFAHRGMGVGSSSEQKNAQQRAKTSEDSLHAEITSRPDDANSTGDELQIKDSDSSTSSSGSATAKSTSSTEKDTNSTGDESKIRDDDSSTSSNVESRSATDRSASKSNDNTAEQCAAGDQNGDSENNTDKTNGNIANDSNDILDMSDKENAIDIIALSDLINNIEINTLPWCDYNEFDSNVSKVMSQLDALISTDDEANETCDGTYGPQYRSACDSRLLTRNMRMSENEIVRSLEHALSDCTNPRKAPSLRELPESEGNRDFLEKRRDDLKYYLACMGEIKELRRREICKLEEFFYILKTLKRVYCDPNIVSQTHPSDIEYSSDEDGLGKKLKRMLKTREEAESQDKRVQEKRYPLQKYMLESIEEYVEARMENADKKIKQYDNYHKVATKDASITPEEFIEYMENLYREMWER